MNKNDDNCKFYNVKELANLLGVSKSLIYERIYHQEIPIYRIGRRILIPRSYVDEIIPE